MSGASSITESPDISLVIPCYNEEEVLGNTITRLVRIHIVNTVESPTVVTTPLDYQERIQPSRSHLQF